MPITGQNIKLFLVLILPLYFFIGYSSILNKHTHFYANGIIVTHSHPVKKEKGTDKPINRHNHSSSDIRLFFPGQSDKYFLPSEIHIDYHPPETHNKYVIFKKFSESTGQLRKIPPRSPPHIL